MLNTKKCNSSSFKNYVHTLVGIAQWLEHRPTDRGVKGLIPSQGWVPGLQVHPKFWKQPIDLSHIDVSPLFLLCFSLSPSSFPLSLKKNHKKTKSMENNIVGWGLTTAKNYVPWEQILVPVITISGWILVKTVHQVRYKPFLTFNSIHVPMFPNLALASLIRNQ